jgi:hypothetical protein
LRKLGNQLSVCGQGGGINMTSTCCPVGEAVIYAISWQFFGTGRSQNEVTLEASVDNLYDDVFVGEADN